jgi:anti-sigma factor RsiW
MKRFEKRCRGYEESLCLLASGLLAGPERTGLEKHLATCSACRQYYACIKTVTLPLANWNKAFGYLEPNPAAEQRWASAIRASGKSAQRRLSSKLSLVEWWRQLIWPCRHAWAGMAALWLLLWGVNSGWSKSEPRRMARGVAATPAVMQALFEQKQLLTELIAPVSGPSLKTRSEEHPKPRSELRPNWKII